MNKSKTLEQQTPIRSFSSNTEKQPPLKRLWLISICGLIVLLYACAGAIDRYWAGVAFSKSVWPILILPVVLVALLCLFLGGIWLLHSVLTRTTKPVWLLSLISPALFIGLPFIPKPSFVEGMNYRLQRDFSADTFLDFAAMARIQKIDSLEYLLDEKEEQINALKESYPTIMSLSKYEPRFTITKSHVDIFYGGSLAKHWGVRIIDKESSNDPPFTDAESASALEAFPGIWVYHLPY